MKTPSVQYAFFREVSNRFRRFFGWFDKLIWPPRSIITGEQLAGPGLIEPDLWQQIRFLDGPVCIICGSPREAMHEMGDAFDQEPCAACMVRKPAFDRARAVFAYNDVTSRMILRFKNGGDRTGLRLMTDWFGLITEELISDADIVMAVPLHASRLRKRGYNQSLWLAASIARKYKKKLSCHMLKRPKNTQSQAGRSASGRKRNVAGAFHIPKRHHKKLKGKRVLLIDDVFTTGATVEACCKVLKRAGVEAVDVLTLSRVVSSVDPTI